MIMKIPGRFLQMTSTGLMLVYMLFLSIKARLNRHINDGNILLVEGGHMGDAVVDSTALNTLVDFYVKKGKKVYILCSTSTWKILEMFPFSEHIHRIGIVPNHDIRFADTVRLYSSVKDYSFDIVIGLTSGSHFLWYAVGCTSAAHKFFLIEPERLTGIHGLVLKTFCRISKTKIRKGDVDVNRSQWLKAYMNKLGIDGFVPAIAFIDRQCELELPSQKYIVIAVDSSASWKRWPIEKHIELAKELLRQFEYDICLLGTNVDDASMEKLRCDLINKSERVHDLIGKTSIHEWVEWIRGGEFLIGVDSGAIHIAASVGTQAFCLMGKWHNNRFFPYDIGQVSPNTRMPICVDSSNTEKKQWSCRNCAAEKYIGYRNKECHRVVEKGQSCMCLEAIRIEDVMRTISSARMVEK